MDSSKRRLTVPLALLTAVGMLSTDLYLPAVPSMAREVGASVAEGQATIAIYLVSLAVSQLGWGWIADRFGDRAAIVVGIWLLVAGSVLCAMALAIDVMLIGRLLQGLGSGAATVVVPALIRRRLGETDAVGALAMVASIESIIPAAGPALGVAIISMTSWRAGFVLIAVAAFVLLFSVSRIVGRTGPMTSGTHDGPFFAIVANGGFVRHCIAYSCMFSALLVFVFSAPHLVTGWFGQDMVIFAILQTFGVGAFMLGARQGTRLANRVGIEAAMRIGAVLQVIPVAAMLVMSWLDVKAVGMLTASWALFCLGLGIRGPSSMSRSLSLARGGHGKAAGVLMFSAFGLSALMTMAIAPFIGYGLLAVAAMMAALIVASMVLVPELLLPTKKPSAS